jgi:hypothetical protein
MINADQDTNLEASQCSLLASNTQTTVSAANSSTVESNVAVGKNMEGGSKSEIRWKVSCDGGFKLMRDAGSNDVWTAPYDGTVSLPACTSCTVSMKDTFGDGWQGNTWVGFGQSFTGPPSSGSGRKSYFNQTFTTSGCPESSSNATNSTDASNDTA